MRSVQLLLLASANLRPRQMRPCPVMRTNFGAILSLAWSMKKELTAFASLVCEGQDRRFAELLAVRGSPSPMAAVYAPLVVGLPPPGRMHTRM